jgi:hypothetical protein
MMGHIILFLRWPVLVGLVISGVLQFLAAFDASFKPGSLNLPDVIPPLNTAILAVLWWRITQLEKQAEYHRDRLDRVLRENQDTQDIDSRHDQRGRDRGNR